ncbi:MAG: methylmalonyl-CoA mutase, partial [Desulfobacteraceae bacterium]|nr:methylmalonyl-CoA mutase [Desulfobacteraceae bacterium]
VDPLAGSYFIESITLEMEEKIIEEMKEVDKLGGIVNCISSGLIQRKVSSQAYEFEKGLQSGVYKKVGLSTSKSDKAQTDTTNGSAPHNKSDQPNVELHAYNEEWAQKSRTSLQEVRAARNDKEVRLTLLALEKAAKGSDNVMPHLVKCCHAYATVGEMAGVFRQTFGEWKEPDFY